jgi:hypothetical protein
LAAALTLAAASLLLAFVPASALADPAADGADGSTPAVTGTSPDPNPAPAADPAGTVQPPATAPDSPPSSAPVDPPPNPAPSTPPESAADSPGGDNGAADSGSSKRSPSTHDDNGDHFSGDSASAHDGSTGVTAPLAAGTQDPTAPLPGATGNQPLGPQTYGATTTDHYDAWNIGAGFDSGGSSSGGTPGAFPRLLFGAAAPALHDRDGARRGGRIAKASPIGTGLRLPGAPGNGRNPFFSLFSGTGGASTSLLLSGLIALLAAFLVVSPRGTRAIRTAASAWRPSAYVPPIELPG